MKDDSFMKISEWSSHTKADIEYLCQYGIEILVVVHAISEIFQLVRVSQMKDIPVFPA